MTRKNSEHPVVGSTKTFFKPRPKEANAESSTSQKNSEHTADGSTRVIVFEARAEAANAENSSARKNSEHTGVGSTKKFLEDITLFITITFF